MVHKRYNFSVGSRGEVRVYLRVPAALPWKKFAPPSNWICADRKRFSIFFFLAFYDYCSSEELGVSGVLQSTSKG
jgi:hypothetical protein